MSCPLPQKDWATLLHIICRYRYLLVTNYLAIKLPVTYHFSACRKYLAENHLSFPSTPRWVQHSYFSKGPRLIPYTCGSSRIFSVAIARDLTALGKWKLVRKNYYYVLKFIVTCYYGEPSLRGLLGVSSPRPEPQLDSPQLSAPT